jgi:hypothetical protein
MQQPTKYGYPVEHLTINEKETNMKDLKKLVAVTLLFAVILFGCSKLTRENYDKIKMGMDYQQVVQIIGNPDKCDAALGAKSCIWGKETKNITIKFIADKVVLPAMNGL